MKGIPSGTAAAAYIAEGVRRSRFPAIEFRDGQPGRVACLVGSRWPVWMIVELVRELNGDPAEALKLIRKPAALVRMALAYADAAALARGEVDPAQALNAGRIRVRGDLSVLVAAQQMLELRRPADPHGVPLNTTLGEVYAELGLTALSREARLRAAATRARHPR